ncbi:MAG TPA: GDSL-type esterase/lipase family protein [Planctomycetaceae bacterium]|nr:GDSL-type esterase/lipase family protein [Planctomycetaceae bacterium]
MSAVTVEQASPPREHHSAAPRRRPVRWTVKLVALLMAIGFALVTGELALRMVWTPPSLLSTPAWGPHPSYGYAPLAGVAGRLETPEYAHDFHHTAQRQRGTKVFTAERPAAVRGRVLFLGDSFTYGLGAGDEETFVGRLTTTWRDYEVANGGANGYGTRNSLAVLDQFGAQFRPDLTVLVFFWNDPEDNYCRAIPEFALSPEGKVTRVDDVPADFDPLAELPTATKSAKSRWTTSYLVAMVKEGLKGARYRFIGAKDRRITTEEQRNEAWAITERYLDMLHRRADDLQTKLVVVSLPDHNQVDPAAVIKNIGPFEFDVQDRLRTSCERLGVPMIDLLPDLQAEWKTNGKQLYYYADRHLTRYGNEVVSKLLQEQLEAHLPQ